jgi:murein DD-endopeptidase MepM/ murein hydrolase activator NlpD
MTEATGKAVQRMQSYMARQDVLLKFRDSAEHSEGVVLDVLHKAGINRTASNQASNQTAKPSPNKAQPSSKTAPGTSAPSAGSKTAPAAPAATPALPTKYAGNYRWPLDAGIVSSEYGARWGKMHKGLDIAADSGEPVYAVAGGEVIYAGSGLSGYGNVVILRHDQQMSSLYAHNSALKVKQGEQVKQGQLIALLGSTGHSTGPHVHFEIRDGDNTVNPRSMLPKSMAAAAALQEAARTHYLANTH